MTRGMLRIYLGAAPGVGKTWAMLDEGRRRAARGADVVVTALVAGERCSTLARADGLSRLPMLAVGAGETVDVTAAIERRPAVALVDDLGRRNPTGAEHPHRWQDVDALLGAGIDVVTTLDIGQLSSMADVVAAITGVRRDDLVPDSFVDRADQIELIDMTPDALRRRLAHGDVFPPDRVDSAMANAFRHGNLAALRELTLRWLADRVAGQLDELDEPAGGRERIVVALTGAPGGERLVRRAARLTADHRGALVGVHVAGDDTPQTERELERQRALLAELGGTYREVLGDDVAAALAAFADAEHATQLVLGASRQRRWATLRHGSLVARLADHGIAADVHVVGATATTVDAQLPRLHHRSSLPPQRRRAGWVLAVAGLPLLCWGLVAAGSRVNLSIALLVNLALVIVVTVTGGLLPGLLASVLAVGLVNWFLTPPVHTLHIAERDDIVALVVFVAITVVVGALVDRAAAPRP
ncbi:MAG: DUF4118 domain-containing protein [Ilumatobacteraceae bacterium]